MRTVEAPQQSLEAVRADKIQYRNIPRFIEQEQGMPELAREIIRINAKGSAERNIYSLEGTGFHVESQVRLLIDNYKKGVPAADSFQQIEQDINGFNAEYLKEAPVFAIPLKKAQRDGKTHIMTKLYGEKLWEETTDEIEREGAVKESVREMARKAAEAKPGSLLLFHSGEGWSGYQAKSGKLEKLQERDVKRGTAQEVRYPDSQTYIVKVNFDGSLTAVTLKAHMNLSQSEAFLAKLTGQEPEEAGLTEKERIKQVVGTVVEFSPKDDKSIQDIVKTMKQIIGSNVAYADSLGRDRSFDEMLFMLQNPRNLEVLDETTQKLSNNFKAYAAWRMGFSDEQNIETDLRTALGYSILRLMHESQGQTGDQIELKENHIHQVEDRKQPPFDPRKALEEMQKRPGCAGGGNNMQIESAGGPRTGILGGDEFGSLQFECPDCKRTNTREKGKLLSRCQYADCRSTKVGCETPNITSIKKKQEVKQAKELPKELKKAA